MRLHFIQNQTTGDWTDCAPDEPGAVAFDKVSGKETPEGRVQRLVAALNCALSLAPHMRVSSTGIKATAHQANGQYLDPGVAHVAEFHLAFDAHISREPGVPEYGDSFTGTRLFAYHIAAAAMGEALKEDAQAAREAGDEAGALCLIRLQLIQEELAELAQGMINRDIVECFDALCDLSYVVDGTFLTLGLGHSKLDGLAEVHRSNMSKLGPDGKAITSSAGRVVKGPSYTRPDLRAVLGLS